MVKSGYCIEDLEFRNYLNAGVTVLISPSRIWEVSEENMNCWIGSMLEGGSIIAGFPWES